MKELNYTTVTNTEYARIQQREKIRRRNKIRRARQLRRRIVIAIATFVLIICSTLGVTSIKSKAQSATEEIKVKQYASVMIPYGSSLYSLADEYIDDEFYDSYDEYINEVKHINHMDSDDIIAGNYIILPYYESI